MKKVIREGVFETNSSSTHSVSFKRKTQKTANKDSSYELHSPLSKILFFIGLCNHAELYDQQYENYPTFTEEEIKELFEEPFPTNEIDNANWPSNKDILDKFKDALIQEYMRMENISYQEFEKRYNESEFTCDGKCFCHYFFDDDVLNDCTCSLDGYSSIIFTLELYDLNTEEDYKNKAKEFLKPEYKFILQEYWCGCMLKTSREIY